VPAPCEFIDFPHRATAADDPQELPPQQGPSRLQSAQPPLEPVRLRPAGRDGAGSGTNRRTLAETGSAPLTQNSTGRHVGRILLRTQAELLRGLKLSSCPSSVWARAFSKLRFESVSAKGGLDGAADAKQSFANLRFQAELGTEGKAVAGREPAKNSRQKATISEQNRLSFSGQSAFRHLRWFWDPSPATVPGTFWRPFVRVSRQDFRGCWQEDIR